MPAALSYQQANDRKLREQVEAERRTRSNKIAAARKYYAGDHWRPLKPDGGVDHNTIINLCKQVVDRQVAFLFPQMPTLELQEIEDTRAEQALRAAWEANGGVLLLQQLAQSGALAGHVFTKVLPEENLPPRIVHLDPTLVSAFWQADDVSTVLWYGIEWGGEVWGKRTRQDVVWVPEKSQWLIYDMEYRSGQWWSEGATEWDYALGPVVDWPHESQPFEYYGVGELEQGQRHLQDQINKISADLSKVLFYHASPRTIGTGVGSSEVQKSAVENFWTIKNKDAKVYNLTLPADALQPSLEYLTFLERQFLAESRVVRLKGDVADFQRVTNLGVKVLFGDMLSKVTELQRRYERGIQAISQRILMLLGFDAVRPKVHWPDPLPQDPMQSMQWLSMAREAGLISRRSMASTLGLDWQLEQLRMMEDGSVELLLGEALLNSPDFGVSSRLPGE